jgi:hypothetical protein
LKKLLILAICLTVSVALVSCGSTTSGGTRTSGIPYRAFVSNPVGGGVNIVNAETDLRATTVGAISAGATPGMMVVTPNRAATLVYSGYGTNNPDDVFTIISNAKESSAAQLQLPGYTESIVVSPDSSVAYVAVPIAKVGEQSQGVIEAIGVVSNVGVPEGSVFIPRVRYLAINHGGDRILAFSDVQSSLGTPCDPTPSYLFVVTPSQVNVQPCPAIPLPGVNYPFDHPVSAFFSSDDTTAYVINCGAECGGVQASVQKLEMTPTDCLPDGVCAPVAVPAASEALVNGSTMYLAGTPYANGSPSQVCTGETTAATTCGLLTIFNLSSMTVANSTPIVITDGYHNRIAMGANGQLFVGARTCTEIIPPNPPPSGAEVRGCLSIYNTLTTAAGNVPAGGVVIPPVNGDVTGIQPIGTRDVVYVVQGYAVPGGSLYIYCAAIDAGDNCPTVDAAQIPPTNNPTYAPLLVGNFYDVVTVDF